MKSIVLFLSILGFEYDLSNKTIKDGNVSYVQNIEKKVIYNKDTAKLFRFEKDKSVNYEGERISFVISDSNKLLGYSIFNAKDILQNKSKLPTEEESRKIAIVFIKEVAPDLIDNMKVLWMKPHDEPLVHENKKYTITGMKVKCRDLNTGLYFWVIIGADKKIMAFERNIKWIAFPGKRGTEKWLDDDWVANHNPF